MMRQYLDIKEQNPDCILFFRLGDFYETFFEDAELASRELELTLTGKDCGLEKRAPMCGIPHHAAEVYIKRLIEKGYKVAICEQMSDPALSKGLVEREVTRIITPGTIIDTSMLEEHSSNYILSLCLNKEKAGCAFCDISTGEFYAYQFDHASSRLYDELSRIQPREVLTNDASRIPKLPGILITPVGNLEYKDALRTVVEHFDASIDEMGFAGEKLSVTAAGSLLNYLTSTQRNTLSHIMKLQRHDAQRTMGLDAVASSNLELTQTLRQRKREGSLFWVLDKTVTPMGSRMLRSWIERPLREKDQIEMRLDAVEYFARNAIKLDEIREALRPVYDIERLLSRIAYEVINPRDCIALAASLRAVPGILTLLGGADAPLIQAVSSMLDPMEDICALLTDAISLDAPIAVREGGIFRDGYNQELDEYRHASRDGKTWLSALEQKERQETGIKNLKIGYNRVFGYYIEVTRSFYELVPFRYARKQTLANCERFITEELKELEKKILGADDEAMQLEYSMFTDIRAQLKASLARLNSTANGLKMLDALASLTYVALEHRYCRPVLNEDGIYDIENGRHPVVECSSVKNDFVPNGTHLSDDERVMIITGPNMAGKSTYMRQTALIVLMAHIGSFVPADNANISLTDRIFTRIGAADDLYAGESTFMVEMNELASILRHSTKQSLLILDEIGRGTSTFDGLSIAWATVEHIAKTGAKTLFATHYHELSQLEGQLDGVVNYRITAQERGNEVVFLRKIVRGSADKSFGVAVASLAGLPNGLIARARQIMARLEVNSETSIGKQILDKRKNSGNLQLGLEDYGAMGFVDEVRELDVMSMSPIEALNKLFELSEKARNI
ncbi:MAG: DNA mismatch repair protein MutS [Clostridiales bacterium]|nr:DNA mismatch repair protein MutS [Clostridiales bacterium]